MDNHLPKRVLDLEGGINFRDIGGYPSQNGKTLIWRKLFRSGHMAHLTAKDKHVLTSLQLRHVHDFRTQKEQNNYPTPLPAVSTYRDYELSFGSLGQFHGMALRGEITTAKAQQLMEEGYAQAAVDLNKEWGRFLKSVVASQVEPLVFHCLAGKDRTGLAAAVLLMALEVPEQIIIEDYLLTLRHSNIDYIVEIVINNLQSRGARHINEAAIRPYCTVAESYIGSFLHQVKQSFRSHTDYVQRGLGLSAAELFRLRENYLEG